MGIIILIVGFYYGIKQRAFVDTLLTIGLFMLVINTIGFFIKLKSSYAHDWEILLLNYIFSFIFFLALSSLFYWIGLCIKREKIVSTHISKSLSGISKYIKNTNVAIKEKGFFRKIKDFTEVYFKQICIAFMVVVVLILFFN